MNLGGKRCIRKLGVEIVVGQVCGGDTYGILGHDSDACEARANGGGRMMFETVLERAFGKSPSVHLSLFLLYRAGPRQD